MFATILLILFIGYERLEELLDTKDLWLRWFTCEAFIFLYVASKIAIQLSPFCLVNIKQRYSEFYLMLL